MIFLHFFSPRTGARRFIALNDELRNSRRGEGREIFGKCCFAYQFDAYKARERVEGDGTWRNEVVEFKTSLLFSSTTFRFLQKALVCYEMAISAGERGRHSYMSEKAFRSTSAALTHNLSLLQMAIFSINFFYYFLHDCFWDFNHDFVLWQRLRSRWKVVELGRELTHREKQRENGFK